MLAVLLLAAMVWSTGGHKLVGVGLSVLTRHLSRVDYVRVSGREREQIGLWGPSARAILVPKSNRERIFD